MILKVAKWEADSKTFIRKEWREGFLKLVLPEKFAGKVKRSLRLLTLLSVGASVLILPFVFSLLVSLVLVLAALFIEKRLLDYAVFILQPFTDFEIEEEQWVTNECIFPVPDDKYKYDLFNHFGTAYNSKVYAIKFFTYLKSWNEGNFDDTANNICLSFVLEDNNSYSTYLYANPQRNWRDTVFQHYREQMKQEKFNPSQEPGSLVNEIIYWKNLKESPLITQFLKDQPQIGKYYFLPFYIDNGQPVPIVELKITKYQYQVKHRKDLTKNDIEYYYQ